MKNEETLISIELEGLPPTVNQMYRNVTRGSFTRRYKTQACHDFQDMLSTRIKTLWREKPPYEGRVALFIKFFQSDRRRWDLDNRLKALQDCLQLAGVIKDDSQIDFISIERQYSNKNATILTLSAINDKSLG